MRTVLRVALIVVGVLAIGVADSAWGQQPGGRGRGRGNFGGFGQFGGGGGGVTGLLRDENVRKELDLVDEQISKLDGIADKLREDQQAQNQGFDFGSLRELSEEERNARFAEIRKKAEELTAAARKEIDAVLLPHQKERLAQIEVQSQIRFGVERALTDGPLGETLAVTDEQKQKLQAKQEEVEKALQEKIAKARLEAQEELISVLTAAQQAKFKSLVGEPFTFSQQGFGGGGGFGRGGDGGRGGDAGGRGRGRGRGNQGNNDNP
jgi:Spy/CpxP family protein refolding chaperone